MTTSKTYMVTHRTETSTLRGHVTACSREDAISTAKAAWGVTGGEWSADQLPEQVKAAEHARHVAMDEVLEACHV